VIALKTKEQNNFRHALSIMIAIGLLIALVVIVSVLTVKT
jgi:hypothetical protein